MKEQATEGNLNFVTWKTWRQTRSERAPLNWLGTRAKREGKSKLVESIGIHNFSESKLKECFGTTNATCHC